MNAEKIREIRARWDDRHLGALAGHAEKRDRAREAMRTAIDHPRRETVSRRALDLMNAEAARAERIADLPRGLFPELADLFSRDLPRRIEAMKTVDALGLWTGPLTVGSLAESGDRPVFRHSRTDDGTLAAEAAVIAEREETDDLATLEAWDEKQTQDLLGRLEGGFMKNLLSRGYDRDGARVFAVIAGRFMTGTLLTREVAYDRLPDEAYALGAAVFAFGDKERKAILVEDALHGMHADFEHVRKGTFREDVGRHARLELGAAEAGETGRLERLIARSASGLHRADPTIAERLDRLVEARSEAQNRDSRRLKRLIVRLRMDRKAAGGDVEGMEDLGRAGLGSTLGFISGWKDTDASDDAATIEAVHGHDDPAHERVLFLVNGVEPVELPWETVERLRHLALDAAPERLRVMSADPRLDGSFLDACARLIEAIAAASRHLVSHRQSFASLAGLPFRRTPHGILADRKRAWWAVPQGWPTLVRSEGRKGRPIVSRPIADDDGILVGYASFDPWSGELHGKGRYAVYDLGGRLSGRLEEDEGGFRTILELPPMGFVTAPETIFIK